MEKCIRCGNEFEPPDIDDGLTNICGNCADELRAEDDIVRAEAEAEAEAMSIAEWEAEEAERLARDRY